MDDPGSVIEIAERVRSGESTALQQVEDALARIELRNESLNAVVHLDSELARTQARDLDARISAGEDPGPLAGVPIGVKDVERVAGMPATRGSLLHVGSAAADADALLLTTEWNEFRELDWEAIRDTMRGRVLVDGRNMHDPTRMQRLGFEYYAIGRVTEANHLAGTAASLVHE